MSSCKRSFLLVGAGFAAGVAVCAIGASFASPVGAPPVEASGHAYTVSIDEVRRNLVFGEAFAGEYVRRVTMSDGSLREVRLRPVRKDGVELVELTDYSRDGVEHSYLGPNGTTTDGKLMVSVKDLAELKALMRRAAQARREAQGAAVQRGPGAAAQ